MGTGSIPRVWQVAAGTWDRPYADVFLKHAVALIGPGNLGAWLPGSDGESGSPAVVRSFASGPDEGEPVVLRLGQSAILAVGVIAGGYEYYEQFSDVRGWDLQHTRRVRWFELPEPHDFGRKVFGAVPARFSRTWDREVIDYALSIVNSSLTGWRKAPLPPLPEEEPELTELPSRLEPLVGEAHDLLSFYWGPDYRSNLPTEDETVAHVVVPVLKALGWRSEHIAIKWRSIDVALLDPPRREPTNVQFVIEAKKLGSGLEGALMQPKGYAAALGVPQQAVGIVTTDGLRYLLYVADAAGNYKQVAYANLQRLKLSAAALFERLAYSPQREGRNE